MSIQILIFIAGIAIIYFGGELFIRGSSKTARIFGIKPLIVGVVIVAFATSAPEFFVSASAAIRKSRGLALGNIVGSCIANIGLVLGLSSIIRPIDVSANILRREVPILLAATLGFFAICLDLKITRPEALLLLVSFIIFIVYCIRTARRQEGSSLSFKKKESDSRASSFAFLMLGLLGLLIGANLLVASSVNIAKHIGISEVVIGLTAVAIGTSLPELSASLIASAKGESDISVGNVIGSNIFNVLLIVGVVGLIRPMSVGNNVLHVSLPLLVLYTLVLIPILKTGLKISRREGVGLLVSYLLYLGFIFR